MEKAKKGKKTAKPKKGTKGKKKGKNNGSMNFFSKIMLALLFISVITIAVFLIAANFKTDNTDKAKIEISLDSKKDLKKEENSKNNNEEVKKEISTNEIQKDTDKKETKKETTKTETEVKKQETKTQKSKSESESKSESDSKTLSGSWLSSEQGASLTLDEYGYRIDFFGVDASKPITGNYSIEKNLIIFTNDDGECKGTGTYRITFYKNNFSLIAKDDDCNSRRNILEADWEWIEI